MRPLQATAAAALLVLGLTACSDNAPTPRRQPSTQSPPGTPTPPPASDPPPSTPPAEPETATAFLQRWLEVSNAMQSTGDTAEFRSLQRDCDSCQELANFVDQISSRGGSIQTQGSKMIGLRKVGSSGKVLVFEFDLRSQPTRYSRSEDAPFELLPGGTEHLQINVTNTASAGWVVTRQSRIPE